MHSKAHQGKSYRLAKLRKLMQRNPVKSWGIVIVSLAAVVAMSAASVHYLKPNALSAQSKPETQLAAAGKIDGVEDDKTALKSSATADTNPSADSSKNKPKQPPSQPSKNSSEPVNVGGVMSKPGCYAGCATPNPSFSIATNSSITVTAGTNAGPFTATTSNGAAVMWYTPTYNGSGAAPYGFSNTLTQSAATSLEYYIGAYPTTSVIAPGTYTLSIGAIDTATHTKVTRNISVTVVAP